MARISKDVFKDWQDGQSVDAMEYKREREIMRTAINDFDNDVKEIVALKVGPQGPPGDTGPQGTPGVGSVKQALKKDMPTLSKGEIGLAEDTNDVYIGTPTGNELVGGASVMSQLAETMNLKYLTSTQSSTISVPTSTEHEISDVTLTIDEIGVYIFWGFINFSESTPSTGYRKIDILRNGTPLDSFPFPQIPIDGFASYKFTYICPLQLGVGDVIKLKVIHTKGSSLNMSSRQLRALKLGVNMR